MSRENYIPASEVADYPHDNLSWLVNLPDYAPARHLGINVNRLGKLAHLGGFDHLYIAGHSGEVTQAAPVMTSVDEHGQATAGMGGAIVKARVLESHVYPDLIPGTWDDLLHAYRWPDGRLSLNMNEIDSRVAEAGDLRSSKVWAKNLNRALKKGTREITRKHLWAERSGREKYAFAAPWLMPSYSLMQTLALENPDYLMYGGVYWMGGLVAVHGITGMIAKSHGLPLKERRKSLFPGIQLDRILAVEALSRTAPLVKDLRSKKLKPNS